MVDRDHCDLIVIDAINHDVRKPSNAREPKILEDLAVHTRHSPDLIENLFDAVEQFVTQPETLAFVPSFGVGQVYFRFWIDDQWRIH